MSLSFLTIEDNQTNMESIEAYQAMVAKVAAEYAKEKKVLLRTKLEKLREEMGSARENGVDPLLIFPEEIWELILEKVTDWKDLASWAKASHLFDRILTPTKGEWLFGEVLPLVSKYLEKSDVYKCRYVCKHWCAGVDNNLESCKLVGFPCWSYTSISNDLRIDSPKQSRNDLAGFAVTFGFGIPTKPYFDFGYHEKNDDIKDNVAQHPRNPFIGRSVTLVVQDSPPRRFFHELSEFLDIHGPNILHLKFTTEEYLFKSCNTHYEACVMILEKCTNLRSLTLGGVFVKNPTGAKNARESSKLQKRLPLHPCPHLESLEVIMKFTCARALISQDSLISNYSGQLKRLIVKTWKSSYNNLDWNNLKILQIRTGISDELCENLVKVNAPNLREFGIFIEEDNRSPNSFKLLMRIIRHFQNLDTLKLKFFNGFCDFPIDEILSLPQEFNFAPHIQTVSLDIATNDYVFLSCNFLLGFPFLKKIQILERHGHGYTMWNGRRLYSVGATLDDDDDNFQFSEYIKDLRVGSVWDSSVWELLPSLQVIEMCKYSDWEDEDDDDEVVERLRGWCTYRRENCQRSRMDKSTFLRALWAIAQKEKTRQQNLRRDLLRRKLEDWRAGTGVVDETRGFSKEVFSALIKYLDHQDVLNCRQVSRKWQSSVDTALEGYSTETTPEGCPEPAIIPRSYHPASFFDFEYSFTANFASREAMSRHPRNPLIGKAACFCLTRRDEHESADVRQFVERLGKHIWHFSLTSLYGILLNLSQCYFMVHSIVSNCEDLRTLRLSDMKIVMTRPEKIIPWEELWSGNPLPENPNLEALFLENQHPEFQKLQNALLKSYSGQLRCFRTYQWFSDSDVRLSWENLEELHVEEETDYSKGFLHRLTMITAPNLKILDIGNFSNELDFKLVIILINKFPKLSYLKLKLREEYFDHRLSSANWNSMTPGLISHAALTKLEIVTGRKYKMSFEFLMFFPNLKELCISDLPFETWNFESPDESDESEVGDYRRTRREEDGHEREEDGNYSEEGEAKTEEDDGEDDGDGNDHYGEPIHEYIEEVNFAGGGRNYLRGRRSACSGVVPVKTENPPKEEDPDFVQFPENYWERKYEEGEVYEMNFWQMLESLRSLKFVQSLSSDYQEKRVHVFTRDKYDHFRKKKCY